jgi:hypothetical protein
MAALHLIAAGPVFSSHSCHNHLSIHERFAVSGGSYRKVVITRAIRDSTNFLSALHENRGKIKSHIY